LLQCERANARENAARTKNPERLMRGDIARAFSDRVFAVAQARELVSDGHFTADGTLIEAWAGQKRASAPKTIPVQVDRAEKQFGG